MYRVLLKSMYLVCSGYQVTTHSGAAVNGWEPVYNPRKHWGNRTGTKPSGNLSDWLSQHNRSGPSDADLYRLACGFTARCFADHALYL